MKTPFRYLAVITSFFLINSVHAAITVQMNAVDSNGNAKNIGTVTLDETKWGGVMITPDLKGLSPGLHGFHIHENPSCDDKAMAAGGHFDPKKTAQHLGPYGDGHLGDLPVLTVTQNGDASLPSLAPRLTLKDIKGHALMVHLHGDNYSDSPEKLGGGGPRFACGIISE